MPSRSSKRPHLLPSRLPAPGRSSASRRSPRNVIPSQTSNFRRTYGACEARRTGELESLRVVDDNPKDATARGRRKRAGPGRMGGERCERRGERGFVAAAQGRLPSPPQPQFQNHSKYGNNFRSRRIPPAALSRRCPVAAPSSGSPTRLLPHSAHAGAVLNALPIREFSSARVLVVASACVWGLHTAFLNGRVSAHVDYALLKTHARLLFALVSSPPLDPGAIQILTAHPPPLLLQFGASPFASTSSARRVRLPLDVHRAPCKPGDPEYISTGGDGPIAFIFRFALCVHYSASILRFFSSFYFVSIGTNAAELLR
ncbi:hypothetical protein B0H16DRAFT_1513347 [Mycena metata]|uniref:Uncharacterized protein n=1 Tax=Mycena metata TaxID=1033252 RepID=A0AAD7JV46_9AGAR|nr:hypothetical protein B0H16DRAFT_1513347 [Mycena metata]